MKTIEERVADNINKVRKSIMAFREYSKQITTNCTAINENCRKVREAYAVKR